MDKRACRLLCRFADMKPEEVSTAVLLFAFFFLITAPHTIIKALRYADLLQDIGFQALPNAYFLAAVVTGLVVILHSKIQFRLPLQVLIIASLVFFTTTGFLFMFFMDSESPFISYLFWTWASVLVVVLMTHFGLTISEIFNPREAKRLIGFCGSGGILGGFVGGLVGFFLTRANAGKFLLPVACGLLLSCVFVVRAIFIVQKRRQPTASPPQKKTPHPKEVGFKDSYNAVRKSRYLMLIALMVILTMIVSTLIDYQFSSQVQAKYTQRETKQAFLALFFGLLTVFAFFFQILLTSSFLKKTKGIRFTLLMAPLVLMTGSVGILVLGISLFSVTAVKGSDESLTFSLNQSVREILYIPVALDLRYKARPFIDMFINRVAKVIAAVLLFIFGLFLKILGLGVVDMRGISPIMEESVTRYLSWGVLGFTILWIILNLRIYEEYVGTISQKIKRRWSRVDKDVAEKIDIQYTKHVFDTLESKERSPALYAMHLFELLEQGKLTPEVRRMISERVDDAKISSMRDLFNAEGASWFPEIGEETSQENFITDIREIVSLDAYQELINKQADTVMEKGEESEISRMELAKAIGWMDPDAPLVKRLEDLIGDDSPQVVRYAMESAVKLRKVGHIPDIIDKLSLLQTREDAVSALIEYGPVALDPLEKYLKNRKKDLSLKKAIIAVLGRMGSQDAADILLEELDRGKEELTADVVEALDCIRSERPEVRFPEAVPKRMTYALVKKYCAAFLELHRLIQRKDTESHSTLQRTLDSYFTDIFRLLSLYHPYDDIIKAFQNLKTGTKDSMDYAVEMLDNTLDKDERNFILPLIVDISPDTRVQKFQQILDKTPEA